MNRVDASMASFWVFLILIFVFQNCAPSLKLPLPFVSSSSLKVTMSGPNVALPDSKIQVSWQASDASLKCDSCLALLISYDGGVTFGTLQSGLASSGSLSFALPSLSMGNIRVRASLLLNPSGTPLIADLPMDLVSDGISPQLLDGQMFINNNMTETDRSVVYVSFRAQHSLANVNYFCLKVDDSASPDSKSDCWKALSSIGVKPATTVVVANYPVNIGLGAGEHAIYAWVQDVVGNISTLSQIGDYLPGKLTKDRIQIIRLMPESPHVDNVSASPNDLASFPPDFADLSVGANGTLIIKWNVSSSMPLTDRPITLDATYDMLSPSYTSIAKNALNGASGGCTINQKYFTGCYVWTGATSDPHLRVRVRAKNQDGSVGYGLSAPLNVLGGKIRQLAGVYSMGLDVSADQVYARPFPTMDWVNFPMCKGCFVVRSNGEIIYSDAWNGRALYHLDPKDGLIKYLLPAGAPDGDGGSILTAKLTNTNYLALDNKENLIFTDRANSPLLTRFRYIDFAANPPLVKTILGGGTQNGDAVTSPTSLQIDIGIHDEIDWPRWGYSFYNFAMFPIAPLSNGDIYFVSDLFYDHDSNGTDNYPHFNNKALSQASSPRLRIYSSNTNLVQSKYLFPQNTGSLPSGFYPISWDMTLTPDLARVRNIFAVLTNISSSGTITYEIHSFSLNATTGIFSYLGHITPPPTTDFFILTHSNSDGTLYAYSQTQAWHYEEALQAWQLILGNGVQGYCPEKTPALQCSTHISGIYISKTGSIYIFSRGAFRMIGRDQLVRTIAGQPYGYGEGRSPMAGHFDFIRIQQSAKYTYVLSRSNAIYEFAPDGFLNKIAGNYSDGYTDLAYPANQTALNYGYRSFAVDSQTDHVFSGFVTNSLNRDYPFTIVGLDRKTGHWKPVAGGGGDTNRADTDGTLGTDIALMPGGGVLPLLGVGNGKLLTWYSRTSWSEDKKANITYGNSLRIFDVTTDAASRFSGAINLIVGPKKGTASIDSISSIFSAAAPDFLRLSDQTLGTTVCVDQVSVNQCKLPPAYSIIAVSDTNASFDERGDVDPANDRWIFMVPNVNQNWQWDKQPNWVLSALASGTGVVTQLTTLKERPKSIAFARRKEGEVIYYCSFTSGNIIKKNLSTGIETSLKTQTLSNYGCDSNILYNTARQSVVFSAVYYGWLYDGVAEVYDPDK